MCLCVPAYEGHATARYRACKKAIDRQKLASCRCGRRIQRLVDVSPQPSRVPRAVGESHLSPPCFHQPDFGLSAFGMFKLHIARRKGREGKGLGNGSVLSPALHRGQLASIFISLAIPTALLTATHPNSFWARFIVCIQPTRQSPTATLFSCHGLICLVKCLTPRLENDRPSTISHLNSLAEETHETHTPRTSCFSWDQDDHLHRQYYPHAAQCQPPMSCEL